MSAVPPGSGRLLELAVTDLGTIDRVSVVLGPGMTALTGETGAGKTMVVGAIDLLLGGPSRCGNGTAGGRRREPSTPGARPDPPGVGRPDGR